jgi:rod shape-determining protein MreD
MGAVVPVFLGVLGVLVANLPVSVFGGLVPSPLLALMPVYFWTLVRPDLMPPVAVFGIGVLEDLLSGGPPGIWAASFVVCYALIDRERDTFAGLSGVGAVLGFAAAMSATAATAYAIVSVYYWRFPPFALLLVEIAVTVLWYIPGAAFLNWVHRRFVGAARSEF